MANFDPNENFRKCRACGLTKPIGDFYKPPNSIRWRKCKGCYAIYHREYYQKNIDRKRELGRKHQQKRRNNNTEYLKEYNRKRYKANPAPIREASRKYRNDHKEACLEKNRKYYLENKERLIKQNKEYVLKNYERYREAIRQWNKLHADKRKVYNHKRRAIKNYGGNFTENEWIALCKKYEYKCLCCGQKVKLTPDHVIPLCKGGSNEIDNIQPLCLPCNCKKHIKTIDYRVSSEIRKRAA